MDVRCVVTGRNESGKSVKVLCLSIRMRPVKSIPGPTLTLNRSTFNDQSSIRQTPSEYT
jgi:hypothetical protein